MKRVLQETEVDNSNGIPVDPISWKDLSLPEKFHAVGHTIFGLNTIAMSAMHEYLLRYVGYTAIGIQAMAALALMFTNKKIGVLAFLTLAYLAAMAIYGQIAGNWFSFWAADCFYFGLAFLGIWAGSRTDYLSFLLKIYAWILLLALAITSPLMFILLRPAPLGERLVGEGFDFLNACTFLPSLFLLFYSKDLKPFFQYVVYFGLGMATLLDLLLLPEALFCYHWRQL
ncbi:MAG: hypothetical protein V1754_10175 [Pseudomonadota bacterium]